MAGGPAPASLQLTVRFDRSERTSARLAAAQRGPLLRRPVVIFPAAVAAGVAIVPAMQALQSALHLGAASASGNLLLAVAVLAGFMFTARSVKSHNAEQERHEAHPDTYTLSEQGLEISGAEDLELMSWSRMTRVHETDRFFLFVAGNEVQYLPKRALAAGQIEFVRSLILRNRRPALPRET